MIIDINEKKKGKRNLTYDVGRIRKFNNELKTIEERMEHVTNLLEVENYDMIDEYAHTSMLEGNKRFEERPTNITIEQLGTYLIRASDVESSRSGEYSFFETEKDYRKVKIGKDSISTDVSSDEGFANYHSTSDIVHESEYDKHVLFNFDLMSVDDKKRLIKTGLKYMDDVNISFSEDLRSAYEYIMSMLDDGKDRVIVSMLIKGQTEQEIADYIGMARQNVNKRIDKICKKKI